MRTRAERRHFAHKAKNRAKRILQRWHWENAPQRWIGLLSATPHLCSKPCCGNPRRHEGTPTLQEVRANNWKQDYYDECA